MSMSIIKAEEVVNFDLGLTIVDVRSSSEFEKGHIPSAVNIPLFDDRERESIGLKYKIDKRAATIQGIEIASSKLTELIKKYDEQCPDRKCILYCWRGGQRSSSIGWLLDKVGYQVSVIEGGYKGFRRAGLDKISEDEIKLIILGGKTGCAKTRILELLHKKGEQIIDLEALAHHKGSAFGWIGELEQLQNEQFENELFKEIFQKDVGRPIWLENESKSIGRNYIPDSMWHKMKISPLIAIERDKDRRLTTLVQAYSVTQADDLIRSFEKISKRIGKENCKKAITLIRDGNLKEAAELALAYYDKTYSYGISRHNMTQLVECHDKSDDDIVELLLSERRKLFN